MNNEVFNHNACVQQSQPLIASAKTRTFVSVQTNVSTQSKHVHLKKLDQAVTSRKLIPSV